MRGGVGIRPIFNAGNVFALVTKGDGVRAIITLTDEQKQRMC